MTSPVPRCSNSCPCMAAPACSKSEARDLQRFADNGHSAVALGDRQAFTFHRIPFACLT